MMASTIFRLALMIAGAGAVGLWGDSLSPLQAYGICMMLSGFGGFIFATTLPKQD